MNEIDLIKRFSITYDPPCQQRHNELIQAIEEWEEAAIAAKAFVLTLPNGQNGHRPSEYYKQMEASLNRERKAREKYFQAFEEMQKCEVENLVNDSWFDRSTR